MRADIVELVTSIPSSLEAEWIEAKTANNALRFTDWVVAKYARKHGRRAGHLVIPRADRIELWAMAARRGWAVIVEGLFAQAALDRRKWHKMKWKLR